MALSVGSVTVHDDESVTGSGWALARYNAESFVTDLPAVPTLGATTPPYSTARPVRQEDIDNIKEARLRALRAIALRAGASALADVQYLTVNMEVVVPANSAGAGLQTVSGVPTGEPLTTKYLGVV